MKPFKLIQVTLLVSVVALVGYAIALVRRGFSARDRPSAFETAVASGARKLAIPASYRGLHNPFPASQENIEAGMEHFADHCASCHGNDGSGDTMFGRGLYPKPPNMRKAETQNKSDGELYYTIENGVRLSGMPAFGNDSAGTGDEDTWKLVVFIRHLPQLSVAELTTMEQLNPKTDQDRQEEEQEQEFLRGGNPPTEESGSHHHH